MNSRSMIFALAAAGLLSACQTAVRPNRPEPVAGNPTVPATPTTGTVPPVEGNEPALDLPLEAGIPITAASGQRRGEDVFLRLRGGFSAGACDAGSHAALWRKRYAQSPRAFAQHLENILPMLDFVSREVERDGLPAEFALIPLVESWYRPDALGAGGPAGMWQMIGSTARNHGIHIQSGYDGRLSPVESTRAALSYLKTLQKMFDGWQPTVMAYNAGEYRVLNAFKRNGSREASGEKRLPKGLSNITYDYVAKLQALSCLISEPERQGLVLPMDARFVPLEPILVDAKVRTLGQLSKGSGIPEAALRRLNPGFRTGRIVPGVPRLVLMPSGAAPVTVADTDAADDTVEPSIDEAAATSGAKTHRVRAGDTPWSIAKRYGLSIQQLLRVNNLGRKAVLRPGQTLKILP
ncbi:transglycosylase SLT domain-containing protein [Arenimonas oryziterrae]|nr:transglycosylase SLT domain-containing protein [Arenimonas oryziterrae]